MTTKEQERKALEKIKAIVVELGEDSYIATAFAGCFEIAEWNIDCDGADSLKERLEIAEKNADQSQKLAQENQDELDRTKSSLARAKAKQLNGDDINQIRYILRKYEGTNAQREAEAEKNIIKYAETPDSEEFKIAVAEHRGARANRELTEKLIKKIDMI